MGAVEIREDIEDSAQASWVLLYVSIRWPAWLYRFM